MQVYEGIIEKDLKDSETRLQPNYSILFDASPFEQSFIDLSKKFNGQKVDKGYHFKSGKAISFSVVFAFKYKKDRDSFLDIAKNNHKEDDTVSVSKNDYSIES